MNFTSKVIAHRGASGTAPENTLPAFELAWKEGADGVEVDVRLTADSQVVCMHDADTSRVAGTELVVAEQDYASLCELDVGKWKDPVYGGTRIPLLCEVMARVPSGKTLLIEIKAGPEIMKPLFEVIDACPVGLGKVALMVFDLELVRALKAKCPDLKVYWLIDVQSNWLGRSKLKLADVLDSLIGTRADGLGLRCHSGIKREMVQAILGANVDLNVWTVDNPVDARRYASLGVTSISTNCPAVIQEALRG